MAIDPVDSPGNHAAPSNNQDNWGKGVMPTVKPLPPDDPWCKIFRKLFPNCPESEVAEGAAQLKNNMFEMLQAQIKHDAKIQKEAADRAKKVAEGRE